MNTRSGKKQVLNVIRYIQDDDLHRASFPKEVDDKESCVAKFLHRETTELHDRES